MLGFLPSRLKVHDRQNNRAFFMVSAFIGLFFVHSHEQGIRIAAF